MVVLQHESEYSCFVQGVLSKIHGVTKSKVDYLHLLAMSLDSLCHYMWYISYIQPGPCTRERG